MDKKVYAFGLTLIATIHVTFVPAAIAGPLKTPNAFTRGTPAVADEVNGNFAAVEVAVNDNDTRIVAITAENAALLARVAILETANAELTSVNEDMGTRLAELESFLDDLRGVLSLQNDNQGNSAVVFSGVNVHVNNGLGATDSVNGLGNLVIGYDEPQTSTNPVCSDGAFENESDCLANGGVFAAIHKTGSHTLVVGPEHNYSQAGGLLAGFRNTVNGPFAAASGGRSNRASGIHSSVSGGLLNAAVAQQSSISGGIRNRASGIQSSVSGGRGNEASGFISSVSAGEDNTASGASSSIGGGSNNTANAGSSSVSGGSFNQAQGAFSTVSGGVQNRSEGPGSTVGGGLGRSAVETNSWVAGGLSQSN